MSRFKEELTRKMEAARVPEPEPEPDSGPEFKDPAVRAQSLADDLAETRAELVRERQRREEAERRAEAASRPRSLQQVFRKTGGWR